MIKALTANPWTLLIITAVFVAWSTFIGVKAYNMGQTACKAAYLAAEQEQQRIESEAAAEVTKKRAEKRKSINRSGRKITNEAKKKNDSVASPALQSYSNGLWERWHKDHH